MKTLLDEFCTKLGSCLDGEAQARLRSVPINDVTSFVSAFHAAEGLLEPYDQEHWRNVRDLVAVHFTRIRFGTDKTGE